MKYVMFWTCVTLYCFTMATVTGCQTRSEAAFDTSKNAYVACLNAKGAAACQGERAVMEADAAVYASASGRPQVQSPNQTLGIYR